jgi:hypothetical protein
MKFILLFILLMITTNSFAENNQTTQNRHKRERESRFKNSNNSTSSNNIVPAVNNNTDLSNIDFVKQQRESSIDMLIKATADYKAGKLNKDKYIEVAQQVSQISDYLKKVNTPDSSSTGPLQANSSITVAPAPAPAPVNPAEPAQTAPAASEKKSTILAVTNNDSSTSSSNSSKTSVPTPPPTPAVNIPAVTTPAPVVQNRCNNWKRRCPDRYRAEIEIKGMYQDAFEKGAYIVWENDGNPVQDPRYTVPGCNYSVKNVCGWWKQSDGTSKQECKDFNNNGMSTELYCAD